MFKKAINLVTTEVTAAVGAAVGSAAGAVIGGAVGVVVGLLTGYNLGDNYCRKLFDKDAAPSTKHVDEVVIEEPVITPKRTRKTKVEQEMAKEAATLAS